VVVGSNALLLAHEYYISEKPKQVS